jgi:hypothetical protein
MQLGLLSLASTENMTTPPDFRWKLDIDPAYSWFQDFVDHWHSPDISFLSDYEDARPTVYWFSSRHLSELDDPVEVRDRAFALKSILDGAFYLNSNPAGDGLFRPFPLHDLWSVEAQSRVSLPYDSASTGPNLLVEPFSSNCSEWVDNWQSYGNPFRRFESAMLWMARVDSTARGMLQFLGTNGPNWITLYGLLDFMVGAKMSKDDLAKLGRTTKEELKRFTGTANNHAAIGPFARHGELGWDVPKKPMLLKEAQVLMFAIARAFLLERVNTLGLPGQYAIRQSLHLAAPMSSDDE